MNNKKLSLALIIAASLLLSACPWNEDDDEPTTTVTKANAEQELALINSQFPAGVPAAALKAAPEQPLPDAAIWPFANGISRTSGTGRYFGGAYYWTDFLYDAYGANGTPPPAFNSTTPQSGSMTYPTASVTNADYAFSPKMDDPGYDHSTDPYQGNAADIFALGIGIDTEKSYWRVDWLTFADPGAAIIAFGLDIDNNASTGTTGTASQGWPGIRNLRTSGVDAILFISANGVFLQPGDGSPRTEVGEVFIDSETQSFIAHIPHPAFDELPASTWRIYAVSGVNDGAGGFFQNDPDNFGAPSTAPAVFNVGFRDYDDESDANQGGLNNNFWLSNQQAQQLSSGDISKFALALDWSKIGTDEPEPSVEGFSARWYRSSLGPAFFGRAGIYTGDDATTHQTAQTTDDVLLYAGYYDQVQPYAVWIPTRYSYSDPEPEQFTLILHSFTQNYMQARAVLPNFQLETCETLRQSICLTVLGRGVSGFYEFASGIDLWESWHDVNTWFRTDPSRVFTSGFSMGALGSQRLMIKHPDIFAAGVILAGAQSDLPGVADQNGNVPGCFGELQLENLKWNGYYHAGGSFDQLIPFNQQRDTVDTIKNLNYRYTFDHYQNEDHVGWTVKDGQYPVFAEATDWLIGVSAPNDSAPLQLPSTPGEIIYRFTGNDQPSALFNGEFQLDANGAWWVEELTIADPDRAIDGYSGSNPQGCTFFNNFTMTDLPPRAGRVHAISAGIPQAPITVTSPAAVANGSNPQQRPDQNSSDRISATGPHQHEFQYWELGATPAAGGLVTLDLDNIATISVDLNEAGVADRTDKSMSIVSNSVFTLILTGLIDGTSVSADDQTVQVIDGKATLTDLPIATTENPLVVSFP